MESQINSPNFLYDAIYAGHLKRVKRLVKVKSLDSCRVSVAIRIAMNAKIRKKARNEIIKVFVAHPEFKVSEGIEDEESTSSVLQTWIRHGEIDLVKAVVVAHPILDAANACNSVVNAIRSEHLRKPSNEKLQNDVINILLPTVLDNPDADFILKAKSFSLLNIAIACDQFKTVESLLQHPKTDVNKCGTLPIGPQLDDMMTPLMASMICYSKNNDIIKILLDHPKIDVNKANDYNCLPLSWILDNLGSERNFSCLELLLNDGNIDINRKDEFFKRTPLVRLALRETYNQRQRFERNLDSTGEQFYEDKALKLLLAHPKIDLQMKDEEGKNVLHHLIISILWDDKFIDEDASQHKARFGSWYEIISDLLKTHPSLITPDNDGYTPIDIAMEELRDPFYLMKDIIDNHFNNITKETTDKEPKETTDKEPKETTDKEPKETTDKEPKETTDKEPKEKTDKEPKEMTHKKPKETTHKDPKETTHKEPKERTDKEPSKTVSNPDKICWNCDAEDVKLYKCTGCKKAYYCSRACITQDWEIHGGYCVKKQQKRENRKSQ